MTVVEALLAVSGYPIPYRTIEGVALKRGVALDATATEDVLASAGYLLCVADLYVWLYFAPNVTQGGQSYSFTDEQRRWWKAQALRIYDELDDEAAEGLKTRYGYMGAKF